LKNEYEGNLDSKNNKKGTKYILSPNSNFEGQNMYFKNPNLINEGEFSNRNFKIRSNAEMSNQSLKEFKYRDYLSDNNNENITGVNRENYFNHDDAHFSNNCNSN